MNLLGLNVKYRNNYGLLIGICGFIYDMEEQNKLKIQGLLLVMFGLLFQSRIQSRYSGKVAKSFLRFQGSRPGLFYDLSAREFCPLRCSPAPSEREPGLPPQISREKTAASHQSHSEKTSPPFFNPISSHLFRPQILMRSQK